MPPEPGMQITLNSKPGVVVSVAPFAGCTVVLVFWPGLHRPPVVEGRVRPGPWSRKVVTLLAFDDGQWFWDYGHVAFVGTNTAPRSFIPLEDWMRAFAEHIHPVAAASHT